MNALYTLSTTIRSKRVSSYSRSGGNDDYIRIDAHAKADIAAIAGAGCIRHIWITFASPDPMMRRNAVLRMYWDGETSPSVESPIGDFFGQGWGEEYNYVSMPLAASPQEGKALNCYFPMPFGDGARIEIENQSDEPITNFYFYIDYEQHLSMPADAGRFHAWWNREITEAHWPEGETEWDVVAKQPLNPSDAQNYLLADLEGCGKFVGVNYYVDNPGPMWYGEGDDMWRIDGEAWPGSLHGTGTEDFFNCAWCPREVYTHPYFGYPRVSGQLGWIGRTHCYRFLFEEPIYFTKSLRGSIEHGHANNLTLDLSSVSYWYQTEPHKLFLPLAPMSKRQNMPRIGVGDIHTWRHAYRNAQSDRGRVWGSEWRDR